jgi:ABC-type uncharacterized transport system permease subunit
VDDVRQLGEQVKALKALVNDEPATPAPTPAAPATQSKSMGDVADKALDMLGGAVGTVSETLKKLGPEVWRIMIIQQYANAARMIVGPLFALIASIIIYFSLRKATTPIVTDRSKNIDGDSDDMETFKKVMRFITYIVPCICALIVAIQLSDAIAMLINPEYYALKDLLGLMTGK